MNLKIVDSIEVGIFVAGLVYLLGCFVNTTWDIRLWTVEARQITAVLMGFTGGITALAHGLLFDK